MSAMLPGAASGKSSVPADMSLEDYLRRQGKLTYTNVGSSMLPLLRAGKDLFTVRGKGEARAKRGDVVLYRARPGRYVLHRVVKVRPQDYIILGDNCIRGEEGILDAQILGIMESFVRNGKEYRVTDSLCRIYTFCILHSIPLRTAVKKTRRRLVRLLRRLRKAESVS